MVGGLVEDQEVGVRRENARQLLAGVLSSGLRFNPRVLFGDRDVESAAARDGAP